MKEKSLWHLLAPLSGHLKYILLAAATTLLERVLEACLNFLAPVWQWFLVTELMCYICWSLRKGTLPLAVHLYRWLHVSAQYAYAHLQHELLRAWPLMRYRSAMPRFSVLIPAYNVEPYIDACLESVCSQSFRDFEVIVVDDASTDGTAARLTQWEQKDERIRVITHAENQGLHAARKTAVEASTGEYCFFLDSDDEIAPRLYELVADYLDTHPVDILRFGTHIVPETPEDKGIAFEYQQLFNHSYGDLEGEEILKASFSSHPPGWVPWNVWSSVYRGDLLREAFSMMPAQRLTKVEDAYEYFVIASQASTLADLTTICGAVYHVGRGISSRAQMPVARFIREQHSAYDVYLAMHKYVKESARSTLETYTQYFHKRCLEMIEEDLRYRVRGDETEQALQAVAHTWGKDGALDVAYKLTLGRGQWLKAHGIIPSTEDHFNVFQRFLYRIGVDEADPRARELQALNKYFAQQIDEEEQRTREAEAQRIRE